MRILSSVGIALAAALVLACLFLRNGPDCQPLEPPLLAEAHGSRLAEVEGIPNSERRALLYPVELEPEAWGCETVLVKGIVIDISGKPIEGVDVDTVIESIARAKRARCASDHSGCFSVLLRRPCENYVLSVGVDSERYGGVRIRRSVAASSSTVAGLVVRVGSLDVSIRGRVCDVAGLPLRGATVEALGGLAHCNPNGVYSIMGSTLPGGSTVSVKAPGFASQTKHMYTIDSDEVVSADFFLEAEQRLHGRIIGDDGVPLGSALVRELSSKAWTNANAVGEFSLGGLKKGSQQFIVIDVPGFVPFRRPLDASSQDAIEQEFVLRSGGIARGRILDEKGRPVIGAQASWELDSTRSSFTDGAGVFAIEGVPLGRVPVLVTATGYAVERIDVDVLSGIAALVRLHRGRYVSGTIVDELGLPMSGVDVCALTGDGYLLDESTATNAHGEFRAGPLPSHARSLKIQSRKGVRATVEIPESGVFLTKIIVKRGIRISVRLSDMRREPIEEFTVRVVQRLGGALPTGLTAASTDGALSVSNKLGEWETWYPQPVVPLDLELSARGFVSKLVGAVDGLDWQSVVLEDGNVAKGRVSVEGTGVALAGALLQVVPDWVATGPKGWREVLSRGDYVMAMAGEDGLFHLGGVPDRAGEAFRIFASCEGFEAVMSGPYNAGETRGELLQITLRPLVTLEGEVLNGLSALGSARIVFMNGDYGQVRVQCDSLGQFTVTELVPGECSLSVYSPTSAGTYQLVYSRSLSVAPGGDVDPLRVQIGPGTVSAQVVVVQNRSEREPQELEVQLRAIGKESWYAPVVSGVAEFSGLPPGGYRVIVDSLTGRQNFNWEPHGITLTGDASENLVIRLDCR